MHINILTANYWQQQRLSRLKQRRKYWLNLHLWLGLSLGLLLSIYGVTGSILVFHAEIDEWLNSELLTVRSAAESANYQPLATIFNAGRNAMPPQAKHTFAYYPRNSQAAFRLDYALDNGQQSWQVLVNPYNAQVIGKRLMETSADWLPQTAIGFIFKLHYALLIDARELSSVIVGGSGALFLISVLSGLILWWPLTGRWRSALSMKRHASRARFTFDLHKLSGVYTALILLPVLFSGVYMVLPHNVVPVLELFSPVTYRYWFQSTPPGPDAEPITMEQAVAIAVQHYPTGRPHWMYVAYAPTKTYTVCLDGVKAQGSLLQRRCIVMDRYSGKVLDVDDPTCATAGEIFTHWQWPLHSGQALGLTGRILVCLSGLACPVLFITGLMRWLHKRRAKLKVTITRL